MRPAIAVTSLMLLLAGAMALSAAMAWASPTVGDGTGGEDSYDFWAESPGDAVPPGSGDSDTPTGIVRMVDFVLEPLPEGDGECIRFLYGWFPDEGAYQAARDSGAVRTTWPSPAAPDYGMVCADSAPVEADPGQLAEVAWYQVDLPELHPQIAPGWMLVGKPAFLETGPPADLSTTVGTIVGDIVLEAGGAVYVDWGDAHAERTGLVGPHEGPGGPWPDGAISHVYQHRGTYELTVERRWAGTWTHGGVTRPLPVREQAASFTLPVEEVQAIRQ